jgi:hypothetical protein
MRSKYFSMLFAIALTAFSYTFVFAQDAAETLVVTSKNTRGFAIADTRPGGEVSFVGDPSAPLGDGALRLTTNATNAAKAQYMKAVSLPLADITDLAFTSKQVSASYAGGNASYQIAVNLCGENSFTTFVSEPYQNGSVTPGTWQTWDVDAGQFCCSRYVTCGASSVVAGAGGAPFYTLADLKTSFPLATVIGVGVNIGSYNPSYDIFVDSLVLNEITYNFEVYSQPSTIDECKQGGWSTFNPQSGAYKNQGQCVASVATQ